MPAIAAKLGTWLRKRWPECVFALLAAAVWLWVVWDAFRFRLATYGATADFWEHAAAVRALQKSLIHPGNPQILSPVLSPRYVPPLVVAAFLGKVFHTSTLDTMGILATLDVSLLLGGTYYFFKGYFEDSRAPLYGLIALLCSWWAAWDFSNVYQLKIYFGVDCYPSSAAIALTLWALGVAVRTLREPQPTPYRYLGLTLLWACVFVTHPLTAVMTFTAGGLLALTEPGISWKRRGFVVGTLFASILVARLWPYFSAWEVVRGGNGDAANWVGQAVESAAHDEPPHHLHWFYNQRRVLQNLGFALLGLLPIPYLLFKRRALFAVLGACCTLIPFVVNAYVPLPLGHRFILLAVFFLQVLLVWLLLALSAGSPQAFSWLRFRVLRYACALVVAAILGTCAWHNYESARDRFEALAAKNHDQPSPSVRIGEAVGEIARDQSVVLADDPAAWPLPAFGPKIVSLLHPNPLIADADERAAAVREFWRSPDDERRSAIVQRYGVTHVLARPGRVGAAGRFLAQHGQRHSLPHGESLFVLDH